MQNYYTYVIDLMQRPGFACVSTPTVARNKLAATDFVDVSCAAYERDTLSAVAADEKFAINAGCFAARGYSLWRVLRRMEMENVDTQNLLWLTYAMHIEARQATVATMTQHAPRTSVLAPTHGPTVLSQVLDRQVEGFDVARIFDRERSFLSWNLFNPLRAPHDSARATVVMEAAIVVVILVTALGGIAPWSTEALAVPAAFLVHYGAMIVLALASPFALSVTRAGVTMRNRVLVSAHAWLYFLNLSRFGVDRRGHFRAVGETTTADLVTYKEKQRQEKEEAAAKEVEDAKKAKETAARQKEVRFLPAPVSLKANIVLLAFSLSWWACLLGVRLSCVLLHMSSVSFCLFVLFLASFVVESFVLSWHSLPVSVLASLYRLSAASAVSLCPARRYLPVLLVVHARRPQYAAGGVVTPRGGGAGAEEQESARHGREEEHQEGARGEGQGRRRRGQGGARRGQAQGEAAPRAPRP